MARQRPGDLLRSPGDSAEEVSAATQRPRPGAEGRGSSGRRARAEAREASVAAAVRLGLRAAPVGEAQGDHAVVVLALDPLQPLVAHHRLTVADAHQALELAELVPELVGVVVLEDADPCRL